MPVDSTGRPAGRGHTFVIGLAFILSILGKTSVGIFASIGGAILFIEAVSVLTTKRGSIGKLMHVNLVDARCITPQPC
ncbi:membrane-spanning protein [Cutibacterium acnes JCM 18918]|nr:membrane-spanning protein [Cutibacterium acnes JCM 18918]